MPSDPNRNSLSLLSPRRDKRSDSNGWAPHQCLLRSTKDQVKRGRTIEQVAEAEGLEPHSIANERRIVEIRVKQRTVDYVELSLSALEARDILGDPGPLQDLIRAELRKLHAGNAHPNAHEGGHLRPLASNGRTPRKPCPECGAHLHRLSSTCSRNPHKKKAALTVTRRESPLIFNRGMKRRPPVLGG